MNIRKIGFLILMISTIGNSRVPEVVSKKALISIVENHPHKGVLDFDRELFEKPLSLAIAFQQGSIKIEGERISCPDHTNKGKAHNIQIEDLQGLFSKVVSVYLLSPHHLDSKIGYWYKFMTTFNGGGRAFDKNGIALPRSIGELNTNINTWYSKFLALMGEESFEEVKKEQTEKARATLEKTGINSHEIDDLVWPEYSGYSIKHAKKIMDGMRLTKNYLEKNAGSDEKREKMFQEMVSEVKSNRDKLRSLANKENPDPKEMIELLKKPFYLGSHLS